MAQSVRSVTQFIAFRASVPFRFDIPNASKSAGQAGKAGQVYLTNVQQFARQALQRDAKVQIARERVRLPCLPIARWPTEDFQGARLLVLLPGQALGDCTQATMALQWILKPPCWMLSISLQVRITRQRLAHCRPTGCPALESSHSPVLPCARCPRKSFIKWWRRSRSMVI